MQITGVHAIDLGMFFSFQIESIYFIFIYFFKPYINDLKF